MPPVSRTDMPYPLRTLDGEVDVVADEIVAGELVVTGLSTFQDIYVAGTANITGGIIDLENITANTLNVINGTDLNTLDVTGLSTLAGVNAQAISSTGISTTGNITASGTVSAASISSSGFTIGDSLKVSDIDHTIVSYPNTGTGNNVRQTSPTLVTPNIGAAVGTSLNLSGLSASASVQTDASKNLVSVANTGSGLNVLQTSPSLVTPNIGVASGTSLGLSTPLAVTSGGTGQNNLAAVQVGTASVAVNLNGGLTGQVPVQTGTSTTGFIPLQTAGTVLTSNGVGVAPSYQTVQVGVVGGVLPVVNGGTGVTTSTGSGNTVLSNSPTLVTPDIGVANGTSLGLTSNAVTSNATTGALTVVGGIGSGGIVWGETGLRTNQSLEVGDIAIISSSANGTSAVTGALQIPNGGIGTGRDIWCGGDFNTNNTVRGSIVTGANSANATATGTGAIQAQTGGISCARDLWVGARVIANSTADATNTTDGSIRTFGGISALGALNVGGNATGDKIISTNTSQSSSASTGAITAAGGGIGCSRDIWCGQTVNAAAFKLNSVGTSLNFDGGTFTPFMQSDTPANDALVPAITYSTQVGRYQNMNQFTFIYIEIQYVIPSSLGGVPISIGGIPGTYFSSEHLLFSDQNVLDIIDATNENIRPFQLVYNQTAGRWLVEGFRQTLISMVNNVKFYDGTNVGANQKIVLNGVLYRTTL